MPHSSGGGSHSGGSHGGSSHRSSGGGSFSSGGHSGDSGGPNPLMDSKFSRRPYKDAKKYVIYNRRGKMKYVYHEGGTTAPDWALTIVAVLVMSLIFLPIIKLASLFAYYQPHPINVNSYDSTIVIDDHIGVVDDESLAKSLEPFRAETGVAPSIEIVYDSEWIDDYDSLEKFAYNEYLRIFNDEKHWLILISYPDEFRTQEFVDWKWEGMIGDDTYSVTSKKQVIFTDIFQKHMVRSTPDQLQPAITAAFDEFTPRVMDMEKSTGAAIFMYIMLGIYLFCVRYFVKNHYEHMKMQKAYIVKGNSVQLECEYCGCMYISGTITVCPHCGAPIPAYNGE
ncbi:MAG: hypothetical protein KBS68_02465 [Clostridiales bacterium]|nr:hypothetical protein [Candidatus Crickella merdequi]